MKRLKFSFLTNASVIFGLAAATLFPFSDVYADAPTSALGTSVSVQAQYPDNTVSAGNAQATGNNQAAVGFKDGGARVFAPDFVFNSVPLMAGNATNLSSGTADDPIFSSVGEPNSKDHRMLVVNDYTATDGWAVFVALGEFRDKTDPNKILNVQDMTLNPTLTRLYHGTPLTDQDYGTTDPNRITWTRAYQYDSNDHILNQSSTDPNPSRPFITKGVPITEAPWQWDDTQAEPPFLTSVTLKPFDDSMPGDTGVSNPALNAGDRTPDVYFADPTEQAAEKGKHDSIQNRFNGQDTTGDTDFSSHFQLIWGANTRQDNNGDVAGKGWWGLDFYSHNSAKLDVPLNAQVAGKYQATMYWVLTADPIS